MPEYRVHLFDRDGRVAARREIFCIDDDEASLRVRDLLQSALPPYAEAEIWLREQRVAKIKPAIVGQGAS
ncbi:MAG TPA: hypothetical protein VET85_02880 [Stellaceae bacterium]|nr:hypothetical protein [Stellaceae bacterium]